MRHVLVRLILATFLAGCLDPIRPKPPLDVSITAAPVTSAVGATINFVVNAQGNELLQIQVLYGDGVTETTETGGATTARVERNHAYTAAGTYEVIGRAIDAVEGQRDATIQIIVQ
jgi:hypothetical protein